MAGCGWEDLWPQESSATVFHALRLLAQCLGAPAGSVEQGSATHSQPSSLLSSPASLFSHIVGGLAPSPAVLVAIATT